MSERNGDLFVGLLVGGLIGAVVGILYAPKSGKETRKDIARTTDDLLYRSRDEYEKVVERSKTAYEEAVKLLKDFELSAREKVYEAEGKVSEIIAHNADKIQDNKNKLKKAIDAGAAAYRDEKTKKS